MTDDANVLAADKRRAVTRLRELEDNARIDAKVAQFEADKQAEALALARADAFAISRDVVEGRWF
jgi:hypothetical protein